MTEFRMTEFRTNYQYIGSSITSTCINNSVTIVNNYNKRNSTSSMVLVFLVLQVIVLCHCCCVVSFTTMFIAPISLVSTSRRNINNLIPNYFSNHHANSNNIIQQQQQQHQQNAVLLLLASKTLSTTPITTTTVEQQEKQEQQSFIEDVSSSSLSSSFKNFDFLSHWYPVIWERDVPLNKPIKITLFDIDYVIAKTKTQSTQSTSNSRSTSTDTNVICMIDTCVHKKAALSEGRITSSGQFQCAYHGWTFNGTTGQCTTIPQIQQNQQQQQQQNLQQIQSNRMNDNKTTGTAVPCLLHQNMIWIFPGGNLEKSLLVPGPPSISELDLINKQTNKPLYTTTQQIRDLPIDFSILLENIMDPDHGLFAHQAKPFDLYSASLKEPQLLEEIIPILNTNTGTTGYTVTSRVPAIEKLLTYDKQQRQLRKQKQQQLKKTSNPLLKNVLRTIQNIKDTTFLKKQNNKAVDKTTTTNNNIKIATTTFYAPNLVVMGRRDSITNETNFITAFYICPIGVGRSRFMSCNIAKTPIIIPRWIFHVVILNFLDEDTYLIATQQTKILQYEAQYNQKQLNLIQEQKQKNLQQQQQLKQQQEQIEYMSTNVRKSQYVYRSPSDKLSIKIGNFFDTTLNRVPNRINVLQQYYSNGMFNQQPQRQFVLDRYEQHLKICSNSLDVVNRCNTIILSSKIISISIILMKLYTIVVSMSSSLSSGTNLPVTASMSKLSLLVLVQKNVIVQWLMKSNFIIISTLLLSYITYYLANKLKKEFYYKFNESYRDKKVDAITTVWLD